MNGIDWSEHVAVVRRNSIFKKVLRVVMFIVILLGLYLLIYFAFIAMVMIYFYFSLAIGA
jgi:hypothetical protein